MIDTRSFRHVFAEPKAKEVGMGSPTFRWSLAVLTLAVLGGSMAFVVGATFGAALNGHATRLTLAHSPMPQIAAKVEAAPAAAAFAKK